MEYYAHISEDGLRRQTVEEHSQRTAEYAAACLRVRGLEKTAYLTGRLHDPGKLTMGYNDYLQSAARGDPVRRGSVVHTFAGVRFLLEEYHGPHPDTFDDITCELMAYAIGAHHGPFDCVDENHRSGFLHRLSSHDSEYHEAVGNMEAHLAPREELDRLFRAACEEMTPVMEKIQTMMEDEAAQPQDLFFYVGLTARLLLSAVVQGDRRDTAEWMSGCPRPQEPENKRALWNACLSRVEKKLEALPAQNDIQKARREISEQCRRFADRPGGVYRLHAPTGAGKTLSSLRYALAHAARWNKSRILFSAPLLTILEQNAAVIREYVGDESLILEHHSNVVRPEEKAEQLDTQELLTEDWSAPIMSTTLAQLLNTLLDGQMASVRRFQALANSVILLDEVQTVPARLLTLFNLSVNFLSRVCGATVILCSATQPCLEQAEHPLLVRKTDMVPYDPKLWDTFRRTTICPTEGMRLEEIPSFALHVLEQANSLLIVCNKKEEAACPYRSLSGCVPNCYHLSASMCMAHRRAVLEALQTSLRDQKSGKTLCVSTQVMEAGVDISFEQVIRLAAGLDSVIQSAGRCNRSGESPHPGEVHLVPCIDEDLSKLSDIQRGKDATESLLAQYARDPGRFQGDLSSREAVEAYYQRLYRELPRGFQDGPVPDRPYSIFSLLSDNNALADDRSEAGGRYFLSQAFRLAGAFFRCTTTRVST